MSGLKTKNGVAGHQGFTLIEMLIAMIVLSVGLLGLAKLQSTGLRMNDSAYFRSQAVSLGYDMFDRMRGNRTQALAMAYDTDDDGAFGGAAAGGGLAAADVAQWQALIDNLLPGAAADKEGNVTCVNPAGTNIVRCQVTVQWDDSRAGGVANQSIVLESQI